MTPPHVVVPWRGDGGKSRLAPALGAEQRGALSLAMLTDVVDGVLAAGCAVTIGTSSTTAATRAQLVAGPLSQAVEVEVVGGGLDAAVERALASRTDRRDVMVLAADLPGLSAGAVRAMLDAKPSAAVVIGRSHDGGTNALLLRNGVRIATRYGAGSAQAHARSARRLGLAAGIVRIGGIAEDLDDPTDLLRLIERVGGRNPAGHRRAGNPDTPSRWATGRHTAATVRRLELIVTRR